MIEAFELTKRYEKFLALKNVSFQVAPGEILGYLGPNGAGKSTTVKILTGIQPASSGSAKIGGFQVGSDGEQGIEAKRLVGYVPETGALYEALTPVEYLRFVGGLYELDPKPAETRAEELLAYLELGREFWKQRMYSFSKGMKQRVVIAAALMHDPKVIIFDEPLNGLDVNTTVKVKQLIAERARNGAAVLYCSHLLDVVERVCTRIIILARGEIKMDGSLKQILEQNPGKTLEQIFQDLTGERSELSSATSSKNAK